MSLDACARLVERGDPDRFRAAMAAPPAARAALFPLYAFNLEIARAPWVTRESLIAEMRLQWWRDVLADAAAGGRPPAHEVAGPLAELIQARGLDVAPLDAMVEARRRDIEARPFAVPELWGYLEGTAGELLWATCAALGEPPSTRSGALALGRAGGLANWLAALPALAPRGRGLDDDRPEAVRVLAVDGLAALAEARRTAFGPGIPALRAHWMARWVLTRVSRDPAAPVAVPEARKRLRLLALTLRGGW